MPRFSALADFRVKRALSREQALNCRQVLDNLYAIPFYQDTVVPFWDISGKRAHFLKVRLQEKKRKKRKGEGKRRREKEGEKRKRIIKK